MPDRKFRRRGTAPFLALLTLIALCVVPATAPAAITATEITSPGGADNFRLADLDAVPLPTFDVRGRATGASPGDMVDIRCDRLGLVLPIDTVAVNADGTFESLGLPLNAALLGMCNLRAVPAGEDPIDLSRFESQPLGITMHSSPAPNTDHVLLTSQRSGQFLFASAGSCGLVLNLHNTGPGYRPNVFSPFLCAGALFADNSFGDPEVGIDGDRGYVAAAQEDENSAGAGKSQLDLRRSINPVNGDSSTVESQQVRRCVDGGGAVDNAPSPGSCATWEDTGVRLDREIRTHGDGEHVTIADTYVSTDGQGHQLDLQYDTGFVPLAPLFGMDRDEPLKERDVYDSYTFDRSPVSVVANAFSLFGDGRLIGGAGAITYPTAPDRVIYHRPGFGLGGAPQAAGYLAMFRRTVPAGGSATITQVMSHAHTQPEARELARRIEDGLTAPRVAITAPADGSTVSSPNVVARGTAGDDTTLRSVSVNGEQVAVAGDGSWQSTQTLNPGVNAIEVVARDAAGQEARASRTVTYTPPASTTQQSASKARACTVPRVHRRKLLSAERALLRAGCGVKIRARRSRKVKPGRVISQSVSPGRIVPAGTIVHLKVAQKPRCEKVTRRGKTRRVCSTASTVHKAALKALR